MGCDHLLCNRHTQEGKQRLEYFPCHHRRHKDARKHVSLTSITSQVRDSDNSYVYQKSDELAHLLLDDLVPAYVPLSVRWLFENMHLCVLVCVVSYLSDDFGGEKQHEDIDGSDNPPWSTQEHEVKVHSGPSSQRELDPLRSRRQMVLPKQCRHPGNIC